MRNLAITSIATLALLLGACSGGESDYEEDTMVAPVPEETEEPVEEDPSALSSDEAGIFLSTIGESSSPEEVRAVYDNVEDETVRAEAAKKLNSLILTALESATTHQQASDLLEMTLEGSTARTMARIKKQTFPAVTEEEAAAPPVRTPRNPVARATEAAPAEEAANSDASDEAETEAE